MAMTGPCPFCDWLQLRLQYPQKPRQESDRRFTIFEPTHQRRSPSARFGTPKRCDTQRASALPGMFSLSTQCPAGPPGELCVNDDAVCAAVWFNLQTATNECGLPCLSTPIASLPRASPSSALWSSRRARSRFAALSSPTANAALAAATCCPSLLAPLKMSFFSSPFAAASTAASSAASLYARTESERGRESALEWYRAHARARYGCAEGESRIAIPDWDACLFVDVMCELTDMREFEAHDLFDVLGTF